MNKEPDFEEQFESMDSYNNWIICPKGNSPWNKYMGGTPDLHWGVPNNGDKNTSFIRLDCVHHPEDGYVTSGIKSKQTFGDGKIEIKVRFKGGNSSWPAIWLQHYDRVKPEKEEYYEIDICEYFEKRPWCKTGLFMPKHLKWGFNRLFRPKKHPFIKKNDWNIFTCEWNEKHICITLNGKTVIDYKNNGKSECFPQLARERTFTLILSYQYGKPWCLPKCKKQLPLYIDIDYVKYWKNN
jgi:hypothetical protein